MYLSIVLLAIIFETLYLGNAEFKVIIRNRDYATRNLKQGFSIFYSKYLYTVRFATVHRAHTEQIQREKGVIH